MDLKRFLQAQENTYSQALKEIKNGQKKSHWMWFIFPQIKGLGMSPTSRFYAINDLEEAKEYLEHPVLGTRLIEISKALLELKENNPEKIFGEPDYLKLKSSMTLFSALSNTNRVFKQVLDKFYEGKQDNQTLNRLQ